MRCSRALWETIVCVRRGGGGEGSDIERKKNSSAMWAKYKIIQTPFLTSGGYDFGSQPTFKAKAILG